MSEQRIPIEHIAELARLELTEEEIQLFGRQMGDILDYFQRLREIDTEGVEPTTHILPMHARMRPDEPEPSASQEATLSNAPAQEDGFIRIPAVFEE